MNVVGTSEPRPDALGKVTGAARFPADLVRAGMLHAAAVFAHRPHARIVKIETAAARALAGVRAVFVAGDVPYNRFGLIEADQPLLCDDVVRFTGDRVALAVADTAELAREAAALVRVSYDDLPAVFDPRRAMESGAPCVHAGRSNVLLDRRIRKGDVEAGFAAADVVLEAEFATGWQEHAYLAPEAGIAYWEGEKLVLETAGQWLHEDRRQIAAMFRMSEDDVVIRYAKIGGAFGGREDLSLPPLVAFAAFKLHAPVAMVWSREESILGHHKRHPFFIRSKWGATRGGRIVAAQTRMIADGGAYASTSVEVLKAAMTFAPGPYAIENVATHGVVAYTNNVPSGAFRGFGSPQAHFAAESMVARLAEALGIDPVAMRRKNLYREGDVESTGEPLPAGVTIRPVFERCLEELQARFAPKRPPASDSPLRRGIGIACGMKNVGYSFGYPETCTASVALETNSAGIAHAILRIGAADVGQGSHLVLRQIAAETLGVPLAVVEIVAEDSARSPNAGSASASRMTFMGGRAVQDAAEAALVAWRRGERPEATAEFHPRRTTALDPQTGHCTPHVTYGYAAQAIEVEVDVRTGVTRVLRAISVHDVGRAINRRQVEGQIEGCIAQAIGYALTENFIVREGRVLTPHFSTYLLPTTLDVPAEIYPVILEYAQEDGPFGARGVAEMPFVPFAPALAAAIHDATGAWLGELPMTPQRVLEALDGLEAAFPVPAG